MALTLLNDNLDIVAALADEPNDVGGLGAAQLKAKFDEAGNIIKDYINLTLIPEIESDIDAAAQGIGSGGGIDGARILDASIADSKIVNLDGGKIDDGTITAAKYADGSVARAKLAQDAITLQTTDFPNKVVPQRALADSAVSTVKIEDAAVTTAKIADASVTRAKLAQDALYSPIGFINTTLQALVVENLGQTMMPVSGLAAEDVVLTVDQAVSSQLPRGAEVAVWWYYGASMSIVFGNGMRAIIPGEGEKAAPTCKIAEKHDMIALKKMYDNASGDYWLVIGNVEVVS